MLTYNERDDYRAELLLLNHKTNHGTREGKKEAFHELLQLLQQMRAEGIDTAIFAAHSFRQ